MVVTAATFWRTWTVSRRAYPWTYFVGTVVTGVLTIGLAYLAFHAIGGGRVADDFTAAVGSADYLGYIAVGAAAFTFANRQLLWAAKALITEQREGTLAALVVAPAGRFGYLVGFAVFSTLSTLAEVAVVWLFAAFLGVRLPPLDLVAGLAAALVLAVAVFAMSIPLGALMIAAGEAHISQNTVFLSLALLSGFTFPRTYLPQPAQWVAELVPITRAMDAVRGALHHSAGLAEIAPHLGIALVLSIGYAAAGLWWLPRAERRALQRSL
ncbi:MAG: ABC transporter permease [Micromonosporaceae bacterium]